jgi:hypothetical protein
MYVLVRQQCDLSPETVEGALLERPADEVRADEQRERDGTEHSSADRKSQPCLKRIHVLSSRRR